MLSTLAEGPEGNMKEFFNRLESSQNFALTEFRDVRRP